MLGISQVTYIDKVPVRISLHNSKKGFVPLRLGKILSSYQHSKTHVEIEMNERNSLCLCIGKSHVCDGKY